MNDVQDSDSSDSILKELLAPLAQIEPPLSARLRNRTAIADELQRLLATRRQRALPWWRRRLSLPVPIAASFVVIMVLGAIGISRGVSVAPERVAPANAPEQRTSDEAHTPEFYQTETYLCGIGRIKFETGYVFRSKSDDE